MRRGAGGRRGLAGLLGSAARRVPCASKLIRPSLGTAPGGPGEIVVVRLMYQWPVYVPTLGLDVSNMAGNKRLLIATAAFRNEPF